MGIVVQEPLEAVRASSRPWTASRSRCRRASSWRCSGRRARARARSCGSSPGWSRPTRADGRADRRGRHEPSRPAAGRRVRLPALRAVPPHDGPRRTSRSAWRSSKPARGRRSARGSTSCSTWSSSPAMPSAIRRSSRAASGSGWRWRGPWRPGPRSCSSTSRSAPSTRRSATSCAPGSAGSTTRSTSPACSSPTTSRRRSRSPTRSWC